MEGRSSLPTTIQYAYITIIRIHIIVSGGKTLPSLYYIFNSIVEICVYWKIQRNRTLLVLLCSYATGAHRQ